MATGLAKKLGPKGRFKTDEPKVSRKAPGALREWGPALPVYRGGTVATVTPGASHPFFGRKRWIRPTIAKSDTTRRGRF